MVKKSDTSDMVLCSDMVICKKDGCGSLNFQAFIKNGKTVLVCSKCTSIYKIKDIKREKKIRKEYIVDQMSIELLGEFEGAYHNTCISSLNNDDRKMILSKIMEHKECVVKELVKVVCYGDKNVAIECQNCNEIIIDSDVINIDKQNDKDKFCLLCGTRKGYLENYLVVKHKVLAKSTVTQKYLFKRKHNIKLGEHVTICRECAIGVEGGF